MKKELITCFPTEDFSSINYIFLEEEDEEKKRQDEERPNEDNPFNLASVENVIVVDGNVAEALEEVTDEIPSTT